MTLRTTATDTRAYHRVCGDGPALWHLGALLTFKATSAETGQRLWLQEALGERGYASPLHRHTREDEAFYVLDGELSVYVGDDVVRAGAGDFLWGPREVPHAFCVESDTARFLAIGTPGGADGFFFATGEPAGARTVPPRSDGAPDVDALVRAMTAYGVELLGPPPAPRG
jgi:quercetin dioxygenase-like cupin family protein